MLLSSLEKIAKKYNCSIDFEENTFNLGWNIRNVPIQVVWLVKNENGIKLKLKVEFVYGTSQKPSYYSGNFTDVNSFRLNAEFTNNGSLSKFYIISNSAIRNYLFNATFQVKCRDKKLKHFLQQNETIKKIYDHSYNSAEISPMIEVDLNRNQVDLNVNYQSFEINFRTRI
jgi:hypothetical protein